MDLPVKGHSQVRGPPAIFPLFYFLYEDLLALLMDSQAISFTSLTSIKGVLDRVFFPVKSCFAHGDQPDANTIVVSD